MFFEVFHSSSRYLDDLLNIDNPYFAKKVRQVYPAELQLNQTSLFDTEAPFLDLDYYLKNGIISHKICDKRDDFNLK